MCDVNPRYGGGGGGGGGGERGGRGGRGGEGGLQMKSSPFLCNLSKVWRQECSQSSINNGCHTYVMLLNMCSSIYY